MTTIPRGPEQGARSQLVGQGLVLAAFLATLLLAISPTPYVVERPGPVYDTLGTVEIDGEEVSVISVEGAETFPTEGRLDLLTVYLDGSRERPLDWIDVIVAWFDPTRTVLPVDAVFPDGQTQDEADEESRADMRLSQEHAIAAALDALGIDYGSTVVVASVSPGGPAEGVLEPGDELLEIDGEPVATDPELRAAIQAAGTGAEVELGIRRDGVARTVTLTTAPRSEEDPSPVIGVVPGAAYDFPVEVEIRLGDVGGPSAGMMFALGLYDTLTPGALVGGQHVAGTGTITADGAIGAIGGVRQKMYGARDAGASWFLLPAANCAHVDEVPDGLTVFAVETLDEALQVVAAIGDGAPTGAFAGCER